MTVPEINEKSALGVCYLKRYWSQRGSGADPVRNCLLLQGLNLGLHETARFLQHASPSFAEFERWILEINGGALDPARVARLNAALTGGDATDPEIAAAADVFSPEDLAHWEARGYVTLHDAVSPENCRAAEVAIWESIGANPADPSTWYGGREGATIWVPLIHHPALDANRRAIRVRKAFAQLWGRSDIWTTVDRGGFNPPETARHKFQGPHLHFDVSLAMPIPFGIQGILYLTDTAAQQGAFRCVPGFHHMVHDWLHGLPSEADPRAENLEAFGAIPIAGCAGDLILWRQELPHGASPNRTAKPRIVQYISGQPSEWEVHPVWK
jgi:hypothetical protein